jgi:hypothetical protein
MKHNEPIQPTSAAAPIPTLPDRTALSLLYPEATKDVRVKDVADIPSPPTSELLDVRPLVINRVVVSLLLFLPVITTVLLVLFIYQNAATFPPKPLASLQNFYATGLGLLLCVLSFRNLAKRFEACDISLSIFTVLYLFFLFPAIKLTYGMMQGGVSGVGYALGILLLVTFFAVFYMTWALNRQAVSYGRRLLIIVIPVFILAMSAAFA